MRVKHKGDVLSDVHHAIEREYERGFGEGDIDAIYLSRGSWNDFMCQVNARHMFIEPPRPIVIKEIQPVRVDSKWFRQQNTHWDNLNDRPVDVASFNTEEVIYMGVKIRREYR